MSASLRHLCCFRASSHGGAITNAFFGIDHYDPPQVQVRSFAIAKTSGRF
jgi:hypothetical protein